MTITTSINKDNKSTRFISLFLLSILFSQELASFSYACHSLNNNSDVSYLNSITSNNYSFRSDTSTKAPKTIKKSTSTRNVKALLSGPGQVESSGFSLNSTDELVDKFTGDFSYSIPLMDVEGYPIVLKYNSNVSMNTEASWVGLGWDLSLGAVSREMRGIPDEFNGNQEIVRTFNEKQDKTEGKKYGGYLGFGKEIKGFFTPSVQVTALFGNYDNSILGHGKTLDIGLQSQYSISNTDQTQTLGVGFGIGYSRDTKNGIGINKNFGVTGGVALKDWEPGGSVSFGSSYNSRKGLISKSFEWSASKHYFNDGGFGTSTTVTYGTQTSIPRVNANVIGISKAYNAKLFCSVKIPGKFVFSAGAKFEDYEVKNTLDLVDNKIIQPAFGYFHSGKRAAYDGNGKYPIMDFNRTSEVAYSEEMKNLSFSIQTYDLFYVNAMGLSGTFRAKRNDIGTYYDPEASIKINEKQPIENAGDLLNNIVDVDMVEGSVGVSISVKPPKYSIQLGLAAGYMPGSVESGVLKQEGAGNVLEFTPQNNGNGFDNSIYFKSIGENTPETLNAYNELNGTTADFFELVSTTDKEIHLTNKLNNKGTLIDAVSLNSVNASAINTPFSATYFNPKTVADFSSNAAFWDYSTASPTKIYRNGGIYSSNHISAIEVVSTDGIRYNYGIPVYSIKNDEVTFASQGLTLVPDQSGLITYTPGVDNSVSNTRGWTNYFDKTEMPAYAHSFLLTEMTSSDYIDRTGDGPTLDDVGSYHKFNYSRIYKAEGNNAYKWRYPVSGGTTSEALQSKGFLGSDRDDMAHYTYGEKEIWYAHSIESKNLIAEFVLEDRADAYSVNSENGGLDLTKPLKRIKKIVLYNRADKLAHPSTCKPLQTVEFEYDYSLCLKTPSNKNTYSSNSTDLAKSGKLTLKRIRVYNGDSKELGLSTYEFEYNAMNPDFKYGDVDAWGNYKPNDPNRPNDIYPYAEQDDTKANQNINAYKLFAIDNPMGGRIEITYEADRYGFVQHKRAMRYMDIVGMTNLFEFLALKNQNNWDLNSDISTNFTKELAISEILSLMGGNNLTGFTSALFTTGGTLGFVNKFGLFNNNFIPNNVIVFKLNTPIAGTLSSTAAKNKVKNDYFNDPEQGPNVYLKDLYFKMKVNVKSGVDELVPCVAEISEDYSNFLGNFPGSNFNDDFSAIGVMPILTGSSDYEYGYVIVNPVNSGNFESSDDNGVDNGGLMMHPLQRMALDYVRQNLPDIIYGNCDGCTPDLSIDNAATFKLDMHKFMIKYKNYVPHFLPASTVRLFESDNVKYGGNARVSKIVYYDNWSAISGEYNSNYQWNYSYPETEQARGIASYETRAIMDENPFYYWDTYINFNKHFPDETKFTPMPIADALYPIPVVGYQDVHVHFQGGNKYGHSSSKFYTSKDFPTLVDKTTIDKSAKVIKHNYFTGSTVDLFGFSQGYSVETNDFHGKPKEMTVYNKQGELQSRSTYKYYGLGEKIRMIDRFENMTNESVALEYDMHADSRFITDVTKFTMLGINLSWTIPSFIPIPGPIFSRNSRERGFYSNALIKHINRSAVLKGIETEQMGSINTAENLVYDKHTGNVLVSYLTDEFNDKLYSVNYPAHWYYNNLRDINGITHSAFSGDLSGGVLTINSVDLRNEFVSGDILKVNGGSSPNAWVLTVNQHSLVLISQNGTKYTGSGSCDIELNQTNRKNRLNEMMQSITTKKSPLTNNNTVFTFPTDEIISANAVTYTTKNSVRCGESGWMDGEIYHSNNEIQNGMAVNPFLYGIKGDLVQDKQFTWQDNRVTGGINGIRFDGTFASVFYPFYGYNSTIGKLNWNKINEADYPYISSSSWDASEEFQKWRSSGKVMLYDEYGNPLETKDQLGIYSAVLYGYNHALNIVPVAHAVNTSQQNIAFDGFEDYDYYSTFPLENDESHFNFRPVLGGKNGATIQTLERHSGLASLKMRSSTTLSLTKRVGNPELDASCESNSQDGISDGEFAPVDCMCIKPFNPIPDEYLVSVWIKEEDGLTKETYTNSSVVVLVDNVVKGTFIPAGKIIDGWQRLEGTFTIPANSNYIEIQLKTSNSNNDIYSYFDDFRIHPMSADMTTVVYDPQTLLPLATHDTYNFTTFFNYDENLNKVRVRLETENGIQTVSEEEFSSKKEYYVEGQ